MLDWQLIWSVWGWSSFFSSRVFSCRKCRFPSREWALL